MRYQPQGKRALDLCLGLILLAAALPVMVLLGLLIAARDGRPVVFRQERAGLRERAFTVYKFRTMREAHDAAGRPLPDGQRLTRLGSWLRRSSLDELPQLWNVLRGEMSLVGPRPLYMRYNARYSPDQARRLEVLPGVTGWCQVNGRNALDWQSKFDLDRWYVDHLSWRLDLRILAATLVKVLRREGISQDGQATMEEFMGNARAGENPTGREWT